MNRLVMVSTTDQLAFDGGHSILGAERKPHPVYTSVEPAELSVHERYHLALPEGTAWERTCVPAQTMKLGLK